MRIPVTVCCSDYPLTERGSDVQSGPSAPAYFWWLLPWVLSMSAYINNVRRYGKESVGFLGYGLLSLFMLFLAYMTYQYGGALSDWKSIVTILALVMMFVITGRLAIASLRGR